jgi:hypothetical protein
MIEVMINNNTEIGYSCQSNYNEKDINHLDPIPYLAYNIE